MLINHALSHVVVDIGNNNFEQRRSSNIKILLNFIFKQINTRTLLRLTVIIVLFFVSFIHYTSTTLRLFRTIVR